jgi:putative hydrolase of the HAD superfamily
LRPLGLHITREQASAILEAGYISGSEGGKAPYPDARTTLVELRRRGFRLGIVTNRAFGGARFRADLRDAGLDIGWDAEAVSVEVGYLKPHPALFEAALGQLGVEANQALMAGDSLAEDIAGAQALGMAAAWRRSARDADGVEPDYTFDEVAELLDIPALGRSMP